MKEKLHMTTSSLVPVLNIGAFSTDELVPGGKPVLTGGFHPVLACNFLAVYRLFRHTLSIYSL